MRRLSREERELWRQLRRSVRPLRTTPPEPREEPLAEPAPEMVPTPQPSVQVPAAKPRGLQPPPLTRLEQRARRRLSRGITGVDARIDLHGMDQARAFAALLGFLQRSRAEGARLVLVITGKGRQGEGRGILRQAVPAWLTRPDLRHLVLGYEEAGLRHGGEGALYVRLRRRREPGEKS